MYAERVKIKDVEKTLEPLFFWWKASRKDGEGFGDFCARHGMQACRDYAASYASNGSSASAQVQWRGIGS